MVGWCSMGTFNDPCVLSQLLQLPRLHSRRPMLSTSWNSASSRTSWPSSQLRRSTWKWTVRSIAFRLWSSRCMRSRGAKQPLRPLSMKTMRKVLHRSSPCNNRCSCRWTHSRSRCRPCSRIKWSGWRAFCRRNPGPNEGEGALQLSPSVGRPRGFANLSGQSFTSFLPRWCSELGKHVCQDLKLIQHGRSGSAKSIWIASKAPHCRRHQVHRAGRQRNSPDQGLQAPLAIQPSVKAFRL